jgi:hypothetical protein
LLLHGKSGQPPVNRKDPNRRFEDRQLNDAKKIRGKKNTISTSDFCIGEKVCVRHYYYFSQLLLFIFYFLHIPLFFSFLSFFFIFVSYFYLTFFLSFLFFLFQVEILSLLTDSKIDNSEEIWREAKVTKIKFNNIRIHFLGWDRQWDTNIDISVGKYINMCVFVKNFWRYLSGVFNFYMCVFPTILISYFFFFF